MVEDAVGPKIGVVAQFAGSREPGGNVIYRAHCSVVVVLMAGDTCGAVQFVVAVDMAIGALPRRYSVHPGQSKSGAAVIKRCVGPLNGVMALLTGLREARLHVIRIGCGLIVL